MGKVKKIDLIYETVKKLDKGKGVTTNELCEVLDIDRANISRDLNNLVKNEQLYKNFSRPVRYYIKDNNDLDFTSKSPLDNLSYLYPSLTDATKLAKTSILYPPNGLNSLIIGETGSGKSMLAKIMHEYASSFYNDKDMPFIHFNCSDYANNVQLLSAHLFGVKKGTFTGATEDRTGLIEKANGGILFLDEIHNLPSEGQEMLFLFMDTGYFRKFGEVSKKIKSNVRIICATNEDINESLLSTFLRRISVKIRIPSLMERGLDERLTLIEKFLKEESINLDKPIYVSYNTMLCFLSYDCPYNIGQLRSDIKLAVANAYTEYFINNKKYIKINSPDLPKYMLKNISKPLLQERDILNNLTSINRSYIYDKNSVITSYSYQKQKQTICKSYLNLIYKVELTTSNKNSTYIDFNEILKKYFDCIESNFEDYRYKFSYTTFDEINTTLCNFNMAIDSFFKYKMYENLFNIHIDLVYDRLSFIVYDTSELQEKLKSLFPYEYDLAISYSNIIEDNLNLYLPSYELILIILICIYILNFQNM